MPFIDSKNRGAFILLYGQEGIGKTSLNIGMPPKDTSFLNLDFLGARVLDGTGIRIFQPDDVFELRLHLDTIKEKYIIADGFSVYLNTLLWETKERRTKGKSSESKTRKDGAYLTQGDYGAAAEDAAGFMNDLHMKACAGHIVIVTSHEIDVGEYQEHDIYPILYRLRMSDDTAARMKFKAGCSIHLNKFDMVGRVMRSAKTDTLGVVFEYGTAITKNRLGWPAAIVATDWSKFLVEQFTPKEVKK